jgi:hypothetical protein
MAQTEVATDLFGQPVPLGPRSFDPDGFLVEPTTVLNTREGDWQKRKKEWESLGIKGELGRKGRLTMTGPAASINYYYAKEKGEAPEPEKSTSAFDPALTETLYRWYVPRGGLILDPFAGGSVRGIVASLTGRHYFGIELRPEQVEENLRQGLEIAGDLKPVWVQGDALDCLPNAPEADFLFSCPPYGDLEQYSDDPRDLSNMTVDSFRDVYREIVRRAADRLRPDRFACFVVGDYRDRKTGNYRNFVSETIAAFRAADLHLYDHAILVVQVASLSMRASRAFRANRKLGKVHQNVLVFIKGDADQATRRINYPEGHLWLAPKQ